MPARKYNISWTDAQNERLKKAIKEYNRQLTKQAKSTPEELRKFLPAKIKVREARKQIKTRDDLRAFERRLAREVREGLDLVTTDRGVTTTRGTLKELDRQVAKINRERKKLLERYKPSPETGTANRYFTATFQPKKFARDVAARDWKKFVDSVRNQARDDYWENREKTYKMLYINAMRKALGNTDAFPALLRMLENMPASSVFEAQYRDPHLQIQLVYPAKGEDPNQVAVDLWTHWEDYADQQDLDLSWDEIYGSEEQARSILQAQEEMADRILPLDTEIEDPGDGAIATQVRRRKK